MNNEPVAWMALNELNGSYSAFTNEQKNAMLPHISQLYGKWIPLYIHPAKTLIPLTDDECEAIINRHDWFSKSWREMAKEIHDAILRKAQE